MKLTRLLLLPFSWIYGSVVTVRNWAYDLGWFKQTSFNLPVIVVGNLDIGGAGKSPMTEYLIRLLKNNHKLATLSRGYGRKTTGYKLAECNADATEIGDEPAQFKRKFPDITVAVCESRVDGIQHLQTSHDLILLDDAFQHRALKPGFSILLFEYSRVFNPYFLLPAGNLREGFSGRKRADVLVVSKCPSDLEANNFQKVLQRIRPSANQPVFFTAIQYGKLEDFHGGQVSAGIDSDTRVFLLTGIANPMPLLQHINQQTPHIIHHNYPDHHQFSLKNIAKLVREFQADSSDKKLILTTEKDAQRLRDQDVKEALLGLPIFIQPITIKFLDHAADEFDQIINNYVREHTAHH